MVGFVDLHTGFEVGYHPLWMVGTEVIPFFVIGIFGVWLQLAPETLWAGEPVVVVVWGPLMVGAFLISP